MTDVSEVWDTNLHYFEFLGTSCGWSGCSFQRTFRSGSNCFQHNTTTPQEWRSAHAGGASEVYPHVCMCMYVLCVALTTAIAQTATSRLNDIPKLLLRRKTQHTTTAVQSLPEITPHRPTVHYTFFAPYRGWPIFTTTTQRTVHM